MNRALDMMDPALRAAIEQSIEHVRAYQEHVLPAEPSPVEIDGATLGMRMLPVSSAGLYVPGGSAVLFSTLIMLAVPAMVAGVPAEGISVVSPPPTRKQGQDAGDISPLVLGTSALLGIERVYRLGGAQAIAALAYGTQTVQPVDMVAGPGNVFVQLAKAMVAGVCGSDNGFYGPSEIVTLADESANPKWVAADLIAQAEHAPGKCFLVAWQRDVLEAINAEVDRQLAKRGRAPAIEQSLEEESFALLAASEEKAIALVDEIASEHVNLAVAAPEAMLAKLKNGGEYFLGHQTPVTAGDYFAGPSHCLPTGTTARFASGISVYTFLKRSGTVHYKQGMSKATAELIARLADAEGLDAHANSARVRVE
jgi:histidinol dehydrogenase